ncbi:hypothetical protein ACH5RR_040294 [Cinchona calisaya]|uniref:Hyaluronan/mRNA-binding protein domain-containing protein n=1 Tax=Cinchona calisaya TaxID=153742 RepID=A0ABD2XRM1_9GENT
MATTNPFDLLGDDDNDDPSQLLAAQQLKAPAASSAPATKKGPAQAQPIGQAKAQPQANLPSKPLPPAEAVREAKNEGQRGGGRSGGRGDGRGRGRGRGGRGYDRDPADNENTVVSNNGYSGGYRASEDGDAGKTRERGGYGGPRGGFRGARRGGFSNGEAAEGEHGERPPRRAFDRHSGTGRGNGIKREGAGRGNWGTPTDEIAPEAEEPINEGEKNIDAEKQSGQEIVEDATKDAPADEPEEKEKEPEDKEMTLEEYQKVLEEKRKNLLAIKPEERKVDLDKDFESMQLLSNKKNDDDVFVKLGSDKDKRKDAGEKAKKSVNINEFLKPAEGDNYHRPGGRGRGRGRGRGGYGSSMYNVEAPSIQDVGQFPSLGGKNFSSSSFQAFVNADTKPTKWVDRHNPRSTHYNLTSSSNLALSPPHQKESHLSNESKPFDQRQMSYVVSMNKKITDCIRCGDLDSALKVFENMGFRTTITWNSILAGFSRKSGRMKDAQQLFDRIPEPDTFSYNIMMACYLHNGDVEAARNFFDRIPFKDFASWNTMIAGFSRNGMMSEAKNLFLAMPEKNNVTWNAMIAGYVESGDLESALELFRENPMKDVIAYTAIVTAFMRSGKVDLAERVFREMPVKNLVTWNSMIAGYVENGRGEEGLKLFKTMLELRINVNESSLSSILLACSNLSLLKLGKQVHQHVVKSPLFLDITVGTSLISMYCKCGDLENAWKLFLEMPRKDVVTWNAMISGYAQHGAGEKALDLFAKMRNNGMKPDWITFVGVLSACNHTGLVDLGIHYFEEMQKDYGVKPRPDHYTCMVDLLSRAGKLPEAMDLIKKMSCKPHMAVFGTLLGACRIYKNLEVAEFAATNLLSLDPTNSAAYVQLANIYAANNRWENVSRIRRLMKENKVIKTPGYTWMEIKNVVHEFRSGDRVHPELEHILEKLNELEKKMKLAGYVPNLESDLHDVGKQQKEQLLLLHSEKLAIAYGLIKLPFGAPIRIFKNLRVCKDCHEATKFIAAIEGREIIVRDTTRFHHFKDGICSCGDYW